MLYIFLDFIILYGLQIVMKVNVNTYEDSTISTDYTTCIIFTWFKAADTAVSIFHVGNADKVFQNVS